MIRVRAMEAVCAVFVGAALLCLHSVACAQVVPPNINGAQGLPGYQPGYPGITPPPNTNGTMGTLGMQLGGVTLHPPDSLQTLSHPGSPTLNLGQPQYKITAPKRCPQGYIPPFILSKSSRTTVCIVDTRTGNNCSALVGYYACGRSASECCAPGTDNTCFPGAYACYSLDVAANGPRTACCFDNRRG